jgi:hypothetical protein
MEIVLVFMFVLALLGFTFVRGCYRLVNRVASNTTKAVSKTAKKLQYARQSH